MRAMPTLALLALSTLAIAACDRNDEGPKTMDEAREEAEQLQRPAPGQYRQVTRITKFEVPGAPPEAAEQMKAMMQGQGQESNYCLTKEDSEKGFEEMFKQVSQGDCRYDRFNATENTIDAIMVCDTGSGGTARLTMNGTVSPTGSTVKVDVDQRGQQGPAGANARIAMEVTSRRTGDCPAGAAKRGG